MNRYMGAIFMDTKNRLEHEINAYGYYIFLCAFSERLYYTVIRLFSIEFWEGSYMPRVRAMGNGTEYMEEGL